MQHLQPNTTLQGGKYRIERVLGQGGFGNTYLGFNTEFEETVAIKEFFMKGVTERDEDTNAISVSNAENEAQFGEQREKFKKEARRLRKLKSEHIVKVHDLFEENGTAYYVMDYIDGESLAERLKRTGAPMTENEVEDILPQILDALKEVHGQDIWHLDLKPGNIMFDKQGRAYLIDFGASKQIRANGSMTTSTALCYTPGYAPNEQIGQMFDRFGPWTDIYALGATLYNLLTNEKPPMAIDIEEDEEDAFRFPNGVSEGMKKLILWMMQPKRKKRPQNVGEIMKQYKEPVKIAIAENEETIITATPKKEIPVIQQEETIITTKKKGAKIANKVTLDVTYVDEDAPCSPQSIDIGLSVKWASCNVGATISQPSGGLFGWSDPTGKQHSMYIKDYVPIGVMATKIAKDIGGSCYDIATVRWGTYWRIPSKNNWEELLEKCQWSRIDYRNAKGFKVVGPNGNSIFLPFTGTRSGEIVSNNGAGYYWTSELCETDRESAYFLYIDSDGPNESLETHQYVYWGRAVRPVCD